jgi:hypothetical protein
MADGQIHSAEFRRTREESWRRLEHLLGRIGNREQALSQEELSELPQLYRTTLSSLSVARNYVLDQRLIAYLEALCLRAYVVVYAPRERLGGLLKHGLAIGFHVRSARRALNWRCRRFAWRSGCWLDGPLSQRTQSYSTALFQKAWQAVAGRTKHGN